MQVSELQAEVAVLIKEWKAKRDYQPTQEFTVLHLVEEVGELAREYVNARIRPDKFDEKKLDNAIADIFFQLIGLAEERHIDFEKLILDTMAEDKPRRIP